MGLFNRTKTETVPRGAPSVAVQDISGDYVLDPSHTRIGFSARHAMVTKVRGQFDEFEGTAHIDTANPANSSSPSRSRPPASPPATSSATVTSRPPTSSTSRTTRPHLRLDRCRARRRRVGHHRRPDHQRRHQARHGRLRGDRLGQGPVRQHPRRLRGWHHDQPHRLGPQLQRRPRDRRRAREREGQARVRHLGDRPGPVPGLIDPRTAQGEDHMVLALRGPHRVRGRQSAVCRRLAHPPRRVAPPRRRTPAPLRADRPFVSRAGAPAQPSRASRMTGQASSPE